MKLLLPFARRFVAGSNVEQALAVVRGLNEQNILVTLDILGESVRHKEMARAAADDYINLLETVDKRQLKCNVSLKLSQMGLEIDPKLAYENMQRIVEAAKRLNNFVRIDMEGSKLLEDTLDTFWQLREQYDNVGIVLQAYLLRTKEDVDKLIERGGDVRLCKGAYKEPSAIAIQDMPTIRKNFVDLMTKLFAAVAEGKPVYPAIATHDDYLIDKAKELAEKMGVDKRSFELQMLYGLRRKLAVELASQGYSVRAYVPYGTEWLPYFYRRLRERKENVFFIFSNFFKD